MKKTCQNSLTKLNQIFTKGKYQQIGRGSGKGNKRNGGWTRAKRRVGQGSDKGSDGWDRTGGFG